MQSRQKYLQNTSLINDSFAEYIKKKNSLNSIVMRRQIIGKRGVDVKDLGRQFKGIKCQVST